MCILKSTFDQFTHQNTNRPDQVTSRIPHLHFHNIAIMGISLRDIPVSHNRGFLKSLSMGHLIPRHPGIPQPRHPWSHKGASHFEAYRRLTQLRHPRSHNMGIPLPGAWPASQFWWKSLTHLKHTFHTSHLWLISHHSIHKTSRVHNYIKQDSCSYNIHVALLAHTFHN